MRFTPPISGILARSGGTPHEITGNGSPVGRERFTTPGLSTPEKPLPFERMPGPGDEQPGDPGCRVTELLREPRD